MYSQEAQSLIKIAQLNPADRSQVVRRLWNIHETSLMKYAVRLSRTMEPDFAMRGMNDAARRDFLMGEVYETFDDAVMLYDPSHKASFVTYLYNKVYWRFHDEKCTNSERADREVSCDKMSFEEDMTEDEILSMCAYGRDENEDLTNGDVNDDIEYGIDVDDVEGAGRCQGTAGLLRGAPCDSRALRPLRGIRDGEGSGLHPCHGL